MKFRSIPFKLKTSDSSRMASLMTPVGPITPLKKVINFSIGKENYELKPNFTTQLNVSSSIISIKSNCMFFRPTVFSYKDKYIDVHHS